MSVSDVQEILRLEIDEDAGEALAFIKENLVKQVKGLPSTPLIAGV